MAITTRTQIPREVNHFYDRVLLERLTPLLTHLRWGQVRDIPRKAGTNTIKFRRYNALAPAITPLVEGITPAGRQLSVTDITATIRYHGDYVTFTDVVNLESPDALLTETASVLAEQGGETLDEIGRDILMAGTTVQFVGQTSRAAITSANVVNVAELRRAVATLQRNNAGRLTKMVSPDNAYATSPLRACFIGITSAEVLITLKGLPTFIPIEKYANKADIMFGEEGSIEGIRIIETSKARVFTGAGAGTPPINVHTLLILGANAYGTTRISGEAIRNIVKVEGGTSDPLEQRKTSGWKATFTTRILNELAMLRLECAA